MMPEEMMPEAYIDGRLHGGPHDGEVVPMPWARLEVPVLGWEGEAAVVSLYRLRPPWRGQVTAHYDFVATT